MSLRSIINLGESLSIAAGINIRILDDGKFDISFCLLKKNKERVKIVKIGSGINSLENLRQELEILPKASVAHINIIGSGLLSRSLGADYDLSDMDRVMGKTFPMVRSDEFAKQILKVENGGILFIVRHQIINVFEELNQFFAISDLTLGICPINTILPFLENQTLRIAPYDIIIDQNNVNLISDSGSLANGRAEVVIGDDAIASEHLLAYASAWGALFDEDQPISKGVAWVENSAHEFEFRKTLYRTGRIFILSCLGVLFLNVLVNFWLTKETTVLEAEQKFTSNQNSQNSRVSERVNKMMAAYSKIGWSSNEIPLYYADQLALQVASDQIKLTTLEVGVLDADLLRKEKLYVYQPTVVKIKGVTASPVLLQQFIGRVEKLSWIAAVADQRYQYDTRQKKGLFEFNIQTK